MKKHVAVIYLLQVFVLFFFGSCADRFDAIKNKTWGGQLYRISDEKELSDVMLKMSDDTLYLYSNAIYGAGNDTLILQNQNDSTFSYRSLSGNVFSFKISVRNKDNTDYLILIGSDYYIFLGPSSVQLNELGALHFYKNIRVPGESYMYLNGAYKGELQAENQMSNVFLAGMGGITVKLVFVDDFKVKMYFQNILADMFSGSGSANVKTVSYNIVGNKLILDGNKSQIDTITVTNYGKTLVVANDELNLIMNKLY